MPPSEPDPVPRRPGPPPVKLDACKLWLRERLTPNPAPVKDVRTDAEKAEFSSKTLYAAKDALGVEEYALDRRKWWKLPEEDAAPVVRDDLASDSRDVFDDPDQPE